MTFDFTAFWSGFAIGIVVAGYLGYHFIRGFYDAMRKRWGGDE